MKKNLLLASLAATVLAAGCAVDTKTDTDPAEKAYTTGSNIPRKKGAQPGVSSISKEDLDRQPMMTAPPSVPRGN
jgi:outer membrane receptor for ferrienterochelin and colicin